MDKGHPDIEFAVNDASGKERIFTTFSEAAGFAVVISLSGRDSAIDVLIYSEEGARAWDDDEGVKAYREDPEASVFQRIAIKANDLGRVP